MNADKSWNSAYPWGWVVLTVKWHEGARNALLSSSHSDG